MNRGMRDESWNFGNHEKSFRHHLDVVGEVEDGLECGDGVETDRYAHFGGDHDVPGAVHQRHG